MRTKFESIANFGGFCVPLGFCVPNDVWGGDTKIRIFAQLNMPNALQAAFMV